MSRNYKKGSRHSASDQQHLDAAAAHLQAAGAKVPETETAAEDQNESTTDELAEAKRLAAQLRALAPHYKMLAGYAMAETLDIQTASQALLLLAQLAQGEAAEGEPDDVTALAALIDGLIDFIRGENAEMRDAMNSPENDADAVAPWAESKSIPSKNADDYLIVGDAEHPTTWHLQVKEDGTPNHRLMGAAWAALTVGFRGNRYDGPDKDAALEKLRKLYASEKMDVPAEKSLAADTLVTHGGAVKTLSQDGDLVTVGGYLIVFGNPQTPDLSEYKDFFTPQTDFGKAVRSHTWFNHTLPVLVNDGQHKRAARITREFPESELSIDDIGVFAKSVLDERDAYQKMVSDLVRQGKLGYSSGTASHLVKRTPMANGTHRIDRWLLGDDASYTHTPAEPRTQVQNLKSLNPFEIETVWQLPEADAQAQQRADAASTPTAAATVSPQIKTEPQTNGDSEANEMTPEEKTALLAEMKTMVSDAAKEGAQQALAALKNENPVTPAGAMKSDADKPTAPAFNHTPRGDDAFKAFTWYLHTGDGSGIRTGEAYNEALKNGDLEVKTNYSLLEGTQYQGQEAVPTEVYAGIVQKRDPISVMRAGKAMIVNAKSNAMTIPIEKASPQAWGITTIDASSTFTTLTQQPIDKLAATLYMFTYNLPFDIQLIDDATFNVDGWGAQYVGRGLGITENTYLLMGTGSSQPQGAVYGSTATVTAASATATTFAELTKLYYSLPTEYQDNVVWSMATATHGAVRGLTGSPAYFVGNGGNQGGVGMGGFPQGAGWLVDPRSRVFTTGAMDALSASHKPVVAMNAEAGYAIVDRKGLTVLRDPYSSANKGLVQVWFYARFSGGIVNSTAISVLATPSA